MVPKKVLGIINAPLPMPGKELRADEENMKRPPGENAGHERNTGKGREPPNLRAA